MGYSSGLYGVLVGLLVVWPLGLLAGEQPDQALRDGLARSLVVAKGSGGQEDVEVVVAELVRALPAHVLQILKDGGTEIVVVRERISDRGGFFQSRYAQRKPRGWPEGQRYADIWGVYDPWVNEVIIATKADGETGRRLPQGGRSLIHEVGHAVDHDLGKARGAGLVHVFPALFVPSTRDRDYRAARQADLDSGELTEYEQQEGFAGRQETYAESFARYYHRGEQPAQPTALDEYWSTDPLLRFVEVRRRLMLRNLGMMQSITAHPHPW